MRLLVQGKKKEAPTARARPQNLKSEEKNACALAKMMPLRLLFVATAAAAAATPFCAQCANGGAPPMENTLLHAACADAGATIAAVLFASINIAGGFLVTHRMLKMFRRDDGAGRSRTSGGHA